MINLCDAAKMSCEVAALPFQAHAHYRSWSIDFDQKQYISNKSKFYKLKGDFF